ncbi:SpoVR family protein [Clostridium tarantellae]|uniref:Stage V sporulation protein R n=1 Tax=Clostridium tarantellae TaxID=39493 RepID=A0A6I1MRX7_9CLOT|nr:SpoVR family protein [Clostridium tarantellae]MPQ43039.1 stage V sporulation protein R [Clostridium tarantellae]
MDYNLKDLEMWNDKIEAIAKNFGLNYYPQEFDIIGFNEMLSYEAYVGMPSRYPHWSYGKAYEKNKTLYSLNMTGLPYEMVINSNPCLAYLMKDNTLLLQILTIAHVYGHNDFFKNNRLFKEGTNANETIEMFKLGADTVRSYINDPSIGYNQVETILDAAHALRFQVPRVTGIKRLSQEEQRKKILNDFNKAKEDRSILEPYVEISPPNVFKNPLNPDDDVLQFIIENGDLEDWAKTILQIVRRESLYFLPQIETKIMNEGWASYWHYTIVNELNLPTGLHLEFLKRHNDVVAPISYGLNPYYLGFRIFQDIEKKYGREKMFEVRALERDSSFIRKYLTKELCEELNLFEYAKKGFDFVVSEVSDDDGWKKIRNTIANDCGVGSIPYIRVKELNKKDRALNLEHVYDGRELEATYAKKTLKHINDLWRRKVTLETKGRDGADMLFICDEK